MNFKYYDADELAKKFGVDRRTFHRKTKSYIVSEFEDELAKFNIGGNPNIALDSDDNIYLVDTKTKKYYPTGANVSEYL